MHRTIQLWRLVYRRKVQNNPQEKKIRHQYRLRRQRQRLPRLHRKTESHPRGARRRRPPGDGWSALQRKLAPLLGRTQRSLSLAEGPVLFPGRRTKRVRKRCSAGQGGVFEGEWGGLPRDEGDGWSYFTAVLRSSGQQAWRVARFAGAWTNFLANNLCCYCF